MRSRPCPAGVPSMTKPILWETRSIVTFDQQAKGVAVAGLGARHRPRFVHSNAQTLTDPIGYANILSS
jgi:phage-related protein